MKKLIIILSILLLGLPCYLDSKEFKPYKCKCNHNEMTGAWFMYAMINPHTKKYKVFKKPIPTFFITDNMIKNFLNKKRKKAYTIKVSEKDIVEGNIATFFYFKDLNERYVFIKDYPKRGFYMFYAIGMKKNNIKYQLLLQQGK